MSRADADLTVVGAGVVGLAIARAWMRRHPADRVVVLDKERELGAHASGRNSGVLHAGLVYPPGSLKARFSRDGNRAMAAYCAARGLPLRRCGKLVLATSVADHGPMDELVRRAAANGVPVEEVDEAEVRRIEPRARTVGRALFAPETCSVDPRAVLSALADDLRQGGADLRLGWAWTGGRPGRMDTSRGAFDPGYVVNCAGLHADRLARHYGFGRGLRVLPFRGLYLVGDPDVPPLACHLYPVPDLELPFLGVHFTAAVDGRVKIGPTATPALWREQYGGLRRFSARDLVEVGAVGAAQWLRSPRFRALARREVRKLWRSALLADAARLVPGLDPAGWTRWGPVGIRAQLVDLSRRELVLDFRVDGDAHSFHVLNAISPGFTCSLPFAELCCDRIEALRG